MKKGLFKKKKKRKRREKKTPQLASTSLRHIMYIHMDKQLQRKTGVSGCIVLVQYKYISRIECIFRQNRMSRILPPFESKDLLSRGNYRRAKTPQFHPAIGRKQDWNFLQSYGPKKKKKVGYAVLLLEPHTAQTPIIKPPISTPPATGRGF